MSCLLTSLRGLLGVAALAWLSTAQAMTALPFDASAQPALRSIGVMPAAEPTECDVYAYTSRASGIGSNLQDLLNIKEFSPLLGVAQAGLQAELTERLLRALATDRGSSAPELRKLVWPSGARGVFVAAKEVLASAGTDAVLAFFTRVGYASFKPGAPFYPWLVVRAVMFDTRSGKLLYDEMVSVGFNPASGDAAQALSDGPGGGVTTLEALRAEPTQAVRAWRAALQPIAEHIARDLSSASPSVLTTQLPANFALPAEVEKLGLGDRAKRLRLGPPAPDTPEPAASASASAASAAAAAAAPAPAPLVLRLPAFQKPYVLRVAGVVETIAKRWTTLVPQLTLLDDKLATTRQVPAARTAVRGGRIEQSIVVSEANAAEVYVVVQAQRQPPLPRWTHVHVQAIPTVARTYFDLSGRTMAAQGGPVEIEAIAVEDFGK